MNVLIYLIPLNTQIDIPATKGQNLLSIRNSFGKKQKIPMNKLKSGRFIFQGKEISNDETLDTIQYNDNQFIYFVIPTKHKISDFPQRNSYFGFGKEDTDFYQRTNDPRLNIPNSDPSSTANEPSQTPPPPPLPQDQLTSEERRLLNDFIRRESSPDRPIDQDFLITLFLDCGRNIDSLRMYFL
jgi:hypothetical protein